MAAINITPNDIIKINTELDIICEQWDIGPSGWFLLGKSVQLNLIYAAMINARVRGI